MKKERKAALALLLFLSAGLIVATLLYQNPPGTAAIRLENGATDTASVPPSLAKTIRVSGQYPAYRASAYGGYIIGTDNGVSQILQVQVTCLKMAW